MISNVWLAAVASTNVRRTAAAAVLALAAAGTLAAQTPAQEPTAVTEPATAGGRADPRHAVHSGVDARVQLLTKELDLDARQQGEVRKILLQQRAEVRQAWNDESVPAAMRVAATRAIGDKTAERIRAILNDGQREKYVKPRPAGMTVGGTSADLATWMDKVNGR
jgi:hypothetical protein